MEKYIDRLIFVVILILIVVFIRTRYQEKEVLWFYSALIYKNNGTKEAFYDILKTKGKVDSNTYNAIVEFIKEKHKIENDPFIITCLTKLND